MSQYKVAKLLLEEKQETSNPDSQLTFALSKREIANNIGVQPSTVGDTLRTLRDKGYAKCIKQDRFIYHPEADASDVGKLEPMTIQADFS